ncbi:MAG: hypothetical protein E6Q77_04755 [Rhizobium sp.]|nr:MAG: hypothetical protein E6Q77_04755 [Rhizobium sp.]
MFIKMPVAEKPSAAKRANSALQQAKLFGGKVMTSERKSGKEAFRAGYFDRFWGCPGCRRILSIAEVIERHCEDCQVAVVPREFVETELASAVAKLEALQ